ncbi:hypothetical protein Tco_1339832 [Tanacetum coccineum]
MLRLLITKQVDFNRIQNPGDAHWTAIMNILKYLLNTKDMFLVYGGNMKRELRVSCYTDAGYLTDADDMKSHTGYVFVLNGDVVDWRSTKQSIFATSSTDAEYIAAFDASKEAVWIHKFISGLYVVPTIKEPITMYCDNTGAITIANDHGVTKEDNLADPFTKALAFPKHSELTRKIGLIPANIANYQYICKPATPPPKWELLEFDSRFCKLYVRNTTKGLNWTKLEPCGSLVWPKPIKVLEGVLVAGYREEKGKEKDLF